MQVTAAEAHWQYCTLQFLVGFKDPYMILDGYVIMNCGSFLPSQCCKDAICGTPLHGHCMPSIEHCTMCQGAATF